MWHLLLDKTLKETVSFINCIKFINRNLKKKKTKYWKMTMKNWPMVESNCWLQILWILLQTSDSRFSEWIQKTFLWLKTVRCAYRQDLEGLQGSCVQSDGFTVAGCCWRIWGLQRKPASGQSSVRHAPLENQRCKNTSAAWVEST